ncbi:hypothetical protein G7Y79_00006g019620 [Physcia stellaris]|nr:hypothetical protein G7Y79_00006g019620 [Physcia stellaris]
MGLNRAAIAICHDVLSNLNANIAILQIHLSCLTPLLSLLFSIYTLLTTTTLLLLQPISYFCTERVPLPTQIRYFLLPPIAFQLRLIYSDIAVPKTAVPSAPMLVLVDLFGPIYAVWVAAAAWVAAAFWAFATIMGDPDGRDGMGGKDDGRAAVLGVRRWWEGWLERGIR